MQFPWPDYAIDVYAPRGPRRGIVGFIHEDVHPQVLGKFLAHLDTSNTVAVLVESWREGGRGIRRRRHEDSFVGPLIHDRTHKFLNAGRPDLLSSTIPLALHDDPQAVRVDTGQVDAKITRPADAFHVAISNGAKEVGDNVFELGPGHRQQLPELLRLLNMEAGLPLPVLSSLVPQADGDGDKQNADGQSDKGLFTHKHRYGSQGGKQTEAPQGDPIHDAVEL